MLHTLKSYDIEVNVITVTCPTIESRYEFNLRKCPCKDFSPVNLYQFCCINVFFNIF